MYDSKDAALLSYFLLLAKDYGLKKEDVLRTVEHGWEDIDKMEYDPITIRARLKRIRERLGNRTVNSGVPCIVESYIMVGNEPPLSGEVVFLCSLVEKLLKEIESKPQGPSGG